MSVIKSKQLEGVHADQLLDNSISAIVDPTVNNDVSQGYKPSSIWVNTILDKVFICSDNSIGAAKWIEIKPSENIQTIVQATHGFSVSQVLKYDGAVYSLAQANSIPNLGIFLIVKVIDANTFVIATNGYFSGLTGGTANTTEYLSDTVAGSLTSTPPAISQPIIYWISATTGWVLGYPYSQAAVAPSSTPLGYNDIRVSFIGANWAYEGLTNNGGGISLSGSTAVSGVAGWRNLVVSPAAVVSVETIPPAEIVSDIFQYTPNPVFDVTNNGYYSSNDPTLRIIAIGYFDGTNLVTVRNYGHGSKKNDDYWETNDFGISATAAGTRLQFTGTWDKTWGSNIVCVDNGAAVLYDDTEGFRITFQKSGKGRIGVTCTQDGTGTTLNKNGVTYKQYIIYSSSNNNAFVSIDVDVSAGDYFTFVNAGSSVSAAVSYFTISFEEN